MSPTQAERIEKLFENHSTTIARDLKLNLLRVLHEGSLSPEDGLFALLATARAAENGSLAEIARVELRERNVPDELIQEAEESAAIVSMLNIYYRFRHLVGNEEDYQVAGLRMTSLARPALGKARFEMLSLAISVLNGCQTCIQAHEKVLRDHGVSVQAIHDLVRIAAVVKGLQFLNGKVKD